MHLGLGLELHCIAAHSFAIWSECSGLGLGLDSTLGLGLECALLHCDLIRRDCDVDAIDVIDLDVAIELLMPYTWI